jgi:hypothetical protein
MQPTDPSHDQVRWRAWFDASLLPIMIFDDERRLTDINPATLLLLRAPRIRVLELRIDDLIAPHHAPSLPELCTEFLRIGSKSGICELALPDLARIRVAYSATADTRSGRHIAILDPQHDHDKLADAAEPHPPLSARERDILALVALGETGPTIARDLHLSRATVETHIRH